MSEGSITIDSDLRADLLAMEEADQAARIAMDRLISDGSIAEAVSALQELDRRNTARLGEILDRHGWPGRSLVGEDGASAAWLLAQHSDDDLPFQRRCLELLRGAVAAGEASEADLAYLTDRVLVAEGLPQRYGTQFFGDGETFGPSPIEDPDGLDERRAAVGLGPFADYERELLAEYGPE